MAVAAPGRGMNCKKREIHKTRMVRRTCTLQCVPRANNTVRSVCVQHIRGAGSELAERIVTNRIPNRPNEQWVHHEQ